LTVALDCLVGDWTDWSERSEDGKIRRTRNVMRNAINGGAMCPNLEQTQLGNLYVLVFFNVKVSHVSAETLTIGRMIPSGTNSPSTEASTQ
jgi:hypothetical protein